MQSNVQDCAFILRSSLIELNLGVHFSATHFNRDLLGRGIKTFFGNLAFTELVTAREIENSQIESVTRLICSLIGFCPIFRISLQSRLYSILGKCQFHGFPESHQTSLILEYFSEQSEQTRTQRFCSGFSSFLDCISPSSIGSSLPHRLHLYVAAISNWMTLAGQL